jgi:hypothetical protein
MLSISMMKKLALSCVIIHQSYAFTHVAHQLRLGRSHYHFNSLNRCHVSKNSGSSLQHHCMYRTRIESNKLSGQCTHLQISTLLYADISAKITGSNAENILDNELSNPSLSMQQQQHVSNNLNDALSQNTPNQLDDDEQYKKQKRKIKTRSNRVKVSIAISSLFTAFLLLISLSGPGQWRYYLAGGMCAAVSHAVTTPIDVIKVSLRS